MIISRRSLLAMGIAAATPRLAFGGSSEKPPLRMAYHPDVPPNSFWDKNTQTVRGILVDLMNHAAKDAGYTLEHRAYPWRRAQLKVQYGEEDALCCPETKERASFALFAPTPVTVLPVGELFFTPGNPKADGLRAARSIEDLYDFTMVTFFGNSTNDKFWGGHPNRILVPDIDQIFELLLHGRADFYVDDPRVTRYQLKQRGLQNKFVSVPAAYTSQGTRTEMKFGLRKTYPSVEKVVADFDAAIQRVITPELEQSVISKFN